MRVEDEIPHPVLHRLRKERDAVTIHRDLVFHGRNRASVPPLFRVFVVIFVVHILVIGSGQFHHHTGAERDDPGNDGGRCAISRRDLVADLDRRIRPHALCHERFVLPSGEDRQYTIADGLCGGRAIHFHYICIRNAAHEPAAVLVRVHNDLGIGGAGSGILDRCRGRTDRQSVRTPGNRHKPQFAVIRHDPVGGIHCRDIRQIIAVCRQRIYRGGECVTARQNGGVSAILRPSKGGADVRHYGGVRCGPGDAACGVRLVRHHHSVIAERLKNIEPAAVVRDLAGVDVEFALFDPFGSVRAIRDAEIGDALCHPGDGSAVRDDGEFASRRIRPTNGGGICENLAIGRNGKDSVCAVIGPGDVEFHLKRAEVACECGVVGCTCILHITPRSAGRSRRSTIQFRSSCGCRTPQKCCWSTSASQPCRSRGR